MSFTGNGNITFSGNRASLGGAIYNGGTLSFTGNGNVVFRGNVEIDDEHRQLRSLCSSGRTVTLSSTTGKSITFYDSIYTSSYSTLELNKSYEDADGNTVAATGAIVFSGATTEADLTAAFRRNGIWTAPTKEEILASRTSKIGKATTLYAGSLEVRDNAVLNAAGITVLASAETEGGTRIALDNGTLNSDVSLADSTTLQLAGANSMSGTLTLQNDAVLGFDLRGNTDASTPMLVLAGTMVQQGALSVGITGASDGKYALLSTTGDFDTSNWTDDKVSVEGAGFQELVWKDNMLYCYKGYADEVIWNGGTVTGSGAATWDKNPGGWLGGDWNLAFTVKFTDAAAGEVTLVGELNPEGVTVEASSGKDYVFSGEGSLTGEMALTKKGKNMLTINTVNSYTGGTFIHEGTLVAGNEKALGQGEVRLEGGVLDLNGQATENAIVAEGGTLVNAGNHNGDIRIGGEVQIDGPAHANNWNFDKDASGKLVLGESYIEATAGKDGHISNATIGHESGTTDTLAIRGDEGHDSVLEDVHIDMAKGGTLILQSVRLNSGVRITDDPARVLMQDVHLTIENGVNVTSTEVTQVPGVELMNADRITQVSFSEVLTQLEIASNALTSVTVDGTTLTLDFEGFDLTDIDLVRLVFGEGSLSASFAEGSLLAVTGVFGEDSYTGMWKEGDDNGVYFSLKAKPGSSNVPEPATATLTLLSLAALAFRRRRKAA